MHRRLCILIVIATIQLVKCYINVPQLLRKKTTSTTTLKLKKNNNLDCSQKFIYKNYLLSVRQVKKTIKNSNAVDISNLIDNFITSLNDASTVNNTQKDAVIYIKNNNTIIDNEELIVKNLILSNIQIDVSNIRQIQISTKNDTLIVNLDKNDNENKEMIRYELGKIDALLNVASILTSLLNN